MNKTLYGYTPNENGSLDLDRSDTHIHNIEAKICKVNNGSATNKLHYHYQLSIFWHQYYEYVYYHDRDSINHQHWVYDHRRFYSCK